MSSVSSGSFTPSNIDPNAGTSAFAVNMDNANNAGAGLLVSPAVGEGPWQGLTVFNRSGTLHLRLRLTFIIQTVGAQDIELVVPPSATYSQSFDDSVISQFSAQYIDVPVAAGVYSGNTMAAATVVGVHSFVVNLVNA